MTEPVKIVVFNSGCDRFAFGRLIGLNVSTCNGSNRAADLRIGLVVQIGKRNARGPVRSGKTGTIQKHDAVVFSQPEGNVERMNIGFDPLNHIFANILS